MLTAKLAVWEKIIFERVKRYLWKVFGIYVWTGTEPFLGNLEVFLNQELFDLK